MSLTVLCFIKGVNPAHNLGKDSEQRPRILLQPILQWPHCSSLSWVYPQWPAFGSHMPLTLTPFPFSFPHCIRLMEWVNMKQQCSLLYPRRQNYGPCPELRKQTLTTFENKIWVIATSTCSSNLEKDHFLWASIFHKSDSIFRS